MMILGIQFIRRRRRYVFGSYLESTHSRFIMLTPLFTVLPQKLDYGSFLQYRISLTILGDLFTHCGK